MSLSPLGARQYQNTALAGSGQQTAKSNNNAGNATAASQTSSSRLSSNVALSPNALDLQSRVDALGNNTLDLAQNFLGSFAQKLFGDNAKGATIAFDSVSLDASSSMSAGLLQSEGTDGVSRAAAFSLDESSHFLGKGTITMADGTKYDFEVEVQYQSSTSASWASSGAQSEREKLIEQNPAMPLPAIEFPDVEWPGSLGDLFKLMDKQASGKVQDDASGDVLGTLSLRLLKLVGSSEALDTYGAGKAGAQAYAAELAASAAKEDGPPAKAEAPKAPAPADDAAAPAPLLDPATPPVPETSVRSADDIPLTVSTRPPADAAS